MTRRCRAGSGEAPRRRHEHFPPGGEHRRGARRDAPRARTEDEAITLAGGPVFLAVEELPEAFETPDAAEQAVPELYGSGILRIDLARWRLARGDALLAPRPARAGRAHRRGGGQETARPRAHAGGSARVAGRPAELAREDAAQSLCRSQASLEALGRTGEEAAWARSSSAKASSRCRSRSGGRCMRRASPRRSRRPSAPNSPNAPPRRCERRAASGSGYRPVRGPSAGKSQRRAGDRRRRRAV